MNILDLVKDQVSGVLASKASEFLGESESGVAKALGGMMPAILGGAIEKAQEPSGAQGIMDLLGGMDFDKMSDIAGIFGGGASSVNNVLNSGGGILDMLLGNKTNGIIEFIAGMAGLKKNSTSSLLKMAAPLLMSFIGKKVAGKGLSGLTDLLMGQKQHVADALPSGLGSVLGLSSLGGLMNTAKDTAASIRNTASATVKSASNTAEKVAGNVANAGKDAAETGMGWLKWLIPLLLIGGLIWWMMRDTKAGDMVKDGVENVGDAAKGAAGAVGDAATATGDAMKDAASGAMDWAKGAFATIDEEAKAVLDKISFTAGSAGDKMMNFINGGFEGDATFRFENLNFDTGKAELKPAAQAEIDNVAAILKAYPGVKIEIQGHTDNTGDAAANKQLSSARANAVFGRLLAQGVDADRMKAMGYGQEKPVADNGTEEGRAQNRRTEIVIVQ